MDKAIFKKISEVCWEIPKNFKPGMRVPVRIFVSEKLLKDMEEGVVEQITNVATLPGIQRYAIALPDSHIGYGFNIGGVAAFDLNEGIISPGGIGFDINCLVGETKVLSGFGYFKDIFSMKESFKVEEIYSSNFKKKQMENSKILLFLSKKANPGILKIKTKGDYEIKVTPDHPLYSNKGMKEAKLLKENDLVAIYPFCGVKYEKPKHELLVNEEDIKNLRFLKSEYSKETIIKELKKRNLLPLYLDSWQVPHLIKILAYNLGDGAVNFTDKSQQIGFWGKVEDLEEIVLDFKKIGYKSRIYSRKRKHQIETKYGIVTFKTKENVLHSQARSLIVLLNLLGVPLGRKASQKYLLPDWLLKSPLWYKRLFLACFFGAELSSPKIMGIHKTVFFMPNLGVNKTIECLENGREFLMQITNLLKEFKIKVAKISEVDEHIGRSGGRTKRLRLQIRGDNNNLLNLYEKINFGYNQRKFFLANIAILYLRLKNKVIIQRKKTEEKARILYKDGVVPKEIYEKLKDIYINKRFLQRSIFEERKTSPRTPESFLHFDEFIKKVKVGNNGLVFDEVEKIEKVPFSGEVYDFTVNHKDHNFIANNFVVSNCGIRILITNLKYEEIKDKIKDLVEKIFFSVPSGLGKEGLIKLNREEFKKIMRDGAKWCLSHGLAQKEDLLAIEDGGCLDGANPETVSEKAMERGLEQVGSLGSGNHFLEIEVVDKIYDKDLAGKYGIFAPGQVAVTIHCGSRGFGHQIATDYLREFQSVMPKYKISVADPELACAPFKSNEGQAYFSAMKCAANTAYTNRQALTAKVKEAMATFLGISQEKLGAKLICDVCHNVAKVESVQYTGYSKQLLIHRKGATRSYSGKPVILGGSMETGSYLMEGTQKAMEETFGSTAHGAGRVMSRMKAKKLVRGDKLAKDLEKRGIHVRTNSFSGLAEEAGLAYKDLSEVVYTIEKAGLSKSVASFRPVGNIKG